MVVHSRNGDRGRHRAGLNRQPRLPYSGGMLTSLMCTLIASMSIATTQDTGDTTTTPLPKVRLEPVMNGRVFREPIQVLEWPGDTKSLTIVERSGRVYRAPLDGGEPTLLLDTRKLITDRNSEEGLLSLAFHPNWPEQRECFVWYSTRKPRQTVLARFKVPDSGPIDATSGEVLLAIDQPYWNHNGGTVLFGPDGMLYVRVGDGGSANDPQGHGQRLDTLLGTVLRLDVSKAGDDTPYAIPTDNPFVDTEGARPEIWAYGLRNIWRMSFDPETGELWAGDVGQNKWEEVDLIVRGGNYGWNAREGMHDFRPSKLHEGSTPIEPIAEYGRDLGGSITGGEVIRQDGAALDGVYLYADYMSGRMWGLKRHADGTVQAEEILRGRNRPVSSFGRGDDGHVYVAAFDAPYTSQGKIYRVIAP